MKIRFCIFLVSCVFVFQALSAMAIEFPGRKIPKYKNVQPIEMNQLHRDFLENKITIIDVRSNLEYETIHIKGAFHVAVAEKSFLQELKKVVRKHSSKKTAFY